MADAPDPDVAARWATFRADLEAALSDGPAVVARIPGWEPATLDVALGWAKEMSDEGWYLAFAVDRSAEITTVWFKIWEYGDTEPTWDSVRATPVDPVPPSAQIW